jgi:hypothetical protein
MALITEKELLEWTHSPVEPKNFNPLIHFNTPIHVQQERKAQTQPERKAQTQPEKGFGFETSGFDKWVETQIKPLSEFEFNTFGFDTMLEWSHWACSFSS